MYHQTAVLVAISCLILGAIVITAGRNQATATFANPSPTPVAVILLPSPTPSQLPSPSIVPARAVVTGTILAISNTTVGTSTSRLIMIQQPSGQSAVYIQPASRLLNSNGQNITWNQLQVGDQIQAAGSVTPDGIIAQQLQVQIPAPTPSPSANPTTVIQISPAPSPLTY